MPGARKWADVSARAGRNDFPYLLFTHFHEIAEGDLPKAVTDAWVMPEFPERLAQRDLWLAAFNRVDFIVDGEPASRDAQPEWLTLFRGCTTDRVDGMSWTTDEAQARWFAGRFKGITEERPVGVYRMEVPIEYVLARFSGRGEAEVVVDTGSLDMDVEAVQTLALTAGGGR